MKNDEVPRRITRHQKSGANVGKGSPVSVKSKKATSPKAPRTLRSTIDKSKSPASPKNSKSPKRTSPRKTIARNLRSVHTLETMTPRRETRRAARLAQRTAIAKSIDEPKEAPKTSKILETLKNDVEEKQKSSRASSAEKVFIPVAPVVYKPPTKDELMLFGEPEENPLMNTKKCEA